MLLSYRDIIQPHSFLPPLPLNGQLIDLIALHCSCKQNHTVYVFFCVGIYLYCSVLLCFGFTIKFICIVACFFALYGLKKLQVVHRGLYVVLLAPAPVIGCWQSLTGVQASTAAEFVMVVSCPGCSISRLFFPSALPFSLLSSSQYFLTIEGVVQIPCLMLNIRFSFILSIQNSPESPHSKHSRWKKNLFCLEWSVLCRKSFWDPLPAHSWNPCCLVTEAHCYF